VRLERSARKEPLTDREVKAILKKVSTVIVSKGKKSVSFTPREVKLADLKGSTGNYRAPMVLKGKTLAVGFNKEALEALL
jgi:hypothetical protein